VTYTDQLNRKIEIVTPPKRIVSLVPSQTELLVDLGLANRIVGVTKFCVHPTEIRKDKVVVGGTKQIDVLKIRALSPDIILCNKEENTKGIVTTLEQEFTVHVSDIFSIEDTIELIQQYGELFDVQMSAKALISKIITEKSSFEDAIKSFPKKRVAYFIWKKPWMVAANHTFINHILSLNNFINVFEDRNRYPEIDDDTLQTIENLDCILLSSEPYPFSEKHIDNLQSLCPNAKILLVDGEFFSWPGSRLTKAFAYFKTLHKKLY